MIEKISVKKVREDAEEHFRKGEFYCSESIVSSIKNNFEVDMPDEMIAMASGFPVGIGKSKCTCYRIVLDKNINAYVVVFKLKVWIWHLVNIKPNA